MPQEYDIVILGNGILGLFSAEAILKKFPGVKLALVGPQLNSFGASIAAGAMHAVYAEIEGTFESSEKDRKYFELGIATREAWKNWLEINQSEQIKTSESTVLYAKKLGTVFERENFNAAIKQGKLDNCVEEISAVEMRSIFHGDIAAEEFDAVRIHGEFSLNPVKACALLSKNITNLGGIFFDASATQINTTGSDMCHILLDNQISIHSKRLIVTTGAGTSDLLKNLFNSVDVVKGVGSAFTLKVSSKTKFKFNEVVRTPNRGGAQCGLHCVPYGVENQYYIGAGNYLSKEPRPLHRAETLRYLIDLSEAEMFGRQVIYEAIINPLIGYRPRSVDGLPLIGQPRDFKNIFIATGTNRLGLTWAPEISAEILSWLSSNYLPQRFVGWEPDRMPRSWGNIDDACRYFAESRISNLIEHKLLSPDNIEVIADKRAELEGLAKKYNHQVIKNLTLSKDFVVDPDIYSVLLPDE